MLEPTTAAATTSELPGGYGEFLLTSLLVLLVICVLAWAVLRFGLRRLYPQAQVGKGSGPIQVLARATLEPKQTLYIVEVGGKMLLIGAGEGGMTTLGELAADAVRASLAEAPPPATFADVVRRIRGTSGGEAP